MRNQILPFGAREYCPKCNSSCCSADFGSRIRYCEGRDDVCSLPCESGIETEHLHIKCPRCEYVWIEACADAENNTRIAV